MPRRKQKNHQIPDIVKEFANTSFKKFKKHEKDYYDSKKQMKNDYYENLICDIGTVINWILRNGHIQNPEIQDIKSKCYAKFAGEEGPEFIKYLTKSVKNYGYDIENIEYLPIILHEMIRDILKYNEHVNEEEGQRPMDPPDDLYELSELILKKRIKKAKKKGIPDDLAFDLLGIMPVPKAAKYSAYFRVRGIFDLLYLYAAKTPDLMFDKIIEFLFDEEDYKFVIGYALQERKEKYKTFTETQKKLFNDISTWVFTALEDMQKDEIEDILRNYIRVRKRDAKQGKDSNRRYYISSLPESIYPRIYKVVSKIKDGNKDVSKYL